MYLAENLKFLREQNGKTQGELAVLFGIEQKTISSWECGSRKPPIGTIVSLAKLYRVSLDDLVLTDMRPPVPVYALNLAYLRKKYGMTQQELVEIIGLKNKSSISLIENGKYKPSIENLEKLADFFGVTMDQIVKQDLSQEVSK
ncbi:helix-turn-helix domain-containing protein [[Eubacterium] rectale]|uniref:helix-turn-helix transcriptional regulator n=1 Tax=Agathobacter rectalis TaxID=39491 RepID=UPI0027D26D22|nr:helix-turn-helix transcriptional regulator [Agathobacter rectalis]MBT9699703.1 helix-turn-helix domain-containing protein [Agathobacter rectalis]